MDKYTIGIIGLGYVGLPLAIEFSKKYKTYGFDISNKEIDELNKGIDSTNRGRFKGIDRTIKSRFRNCKVLLIL